MEVRGHLHAPAALPSGKQPLVPVGEEAGHGGEEKSSLLPPGIEP